MFSADGHSKVCVGSWGPKKFDLRLDRPGPLFSKWTMFGSPQQKLQIWLFWPFYRCLCVCWVCLPVAAGRCILVHVGFFLLYLWLKLFHSNIVWVSKWWYIKLCISLQLTGVNMKVGERPMLWAARSASSFSRMPWWLGTQKNVIFVEYFLLILCVSRMVGS